MIGTQEVALDTRPNEHLSVKSSTLESTSDVIIRVIPAYAVHNPYPLVIAKKGGDIIAESLLYGYRKRVSWLPMWLFNWQTDASNEAQRESLRKFELSAAEWGRVVRDYPE